MADKFFKRLHNQARDAVVHHRRRSNGSNNSKTSGEFAGTGQSKFYADNDNSDTNGNGFEHVSKEPSSGGDGCSAPEQLEELPLRHRQLAQALMSVEGIEDDYDSGSVSSSNGDTAAAVLTYGGGEGAIFVNKPQQRDIAEIGAERSVNVEEESLQKAVHVSPDFMDLGPFVGPDRQQYTGSVVDLEHYCAEAIQDQSSPWYQRLGVITLAWVVDLIDAFSETNDDIGVREEAKPALNVKQLRQNIRRCRSQSRPYLETLAGLWDLIAWRSPLFTLLLFWVYMYCVWQGCVISVLLFLVLLQLGINYLSYCRKVKLGLTLLPRKEIKQETIESPGAQLVLEVARQAQIVLEYVADALEKIKNLLKWKRPKTTAMFSLLVLFWFIVSLFTSTSIFLTIIGFGLGVKIFVTSYLYYRFPRLRHKLDVFTWFLDRTPADHSNSCSKDTSIARSPRSPEVVPYPSISTGADGQDLDLSSAKISRTCALIDKERSFPFNVGSGKLYFTTNHVVFKYSRWTSGERRVVKIPFDDVLTIRKVGSAFALEIYASGRDKPYLFTGVIRRDDCYDVLLTLGRAAGVSWAG